MAYTKTVWVNGAAPAISAENLNKIEQGIYDAHALATSAIPRGVIVMWSGAAAAIPAGWALCDGGTYTAPDGTSVTTPDLRDRFIVGAGGSYAVGATGGEATHVLTVDEMPAHTHSVASAGSHTHTATMEFGHSHAVQGLVSGNTTINQGTGPEKTVAAQMTSGNTLGTKDYPPSIGSAGSHRHTLSSTGGGAAHENRPPYYALCFIMKL